MMSVVDEMVRRAMKARHAAIEQAVEAALQSGDRGVLVVTDRLGGFLGAEPDASVPYGHIYEVSVPYPL